MVKSKFDYLDSEEAKEVQEASSLKEATPVKKKAAKKNQMVYGISVELAKAIEDAGESFSGFAKRAMVKVAREEGII